MYLELLNSYRDCPDVRVENAAIFESAGSRPMYRISPEGLANGALPGWVKGLGSFFADRNALGGVGVSQGEFERIRPFVTVETVACLTLADVLAKHKATQLDLLQVDVEGYDYHVLQQVDWTRWKPKLIRLEWVNLPADEQQAVTMLLAGHGYSWRVGRFDLVAWQAEWFSE